MSGIGAFVNGRSKNKYVIPRRILEALEEKRRKLDREIEDFKAQKDQEYADFERGFCGELLGEHHDAGSPLGEEHEIASMQVEEQSPPPDGRGVKSRDVSGHGIKLESKSSRTSNKAAIEALGGFPSPQDSGGHHDEERKWESVFTPDYLPLLEGRGNRDVRNSWKIMSSPTSAEGTVRSTTSNLSSSDTNHHASAHPSFLGLSCPHAQLSSSAPPHDDASNSHHRSDSSASNISVASLRSSLKDPKQPKSPKRVLFSLGDDVVSPSTSPVIARKHTTGDILTVGSEGLEDVLDGKRKGKGKRTRRKERSSSADEERGRARQLRAELDDNGVDRGNGVFSLVDGWTKTIPAPTPLPRNTTSKALIATTSEDFEKTEKTDNDNLFTFDEDLDAVANKAPLTNGSVAGSLFDVDDVDHDKEPLPNSSPHAGSLPIEIKWPQRREARS